MASNIPEGPSAAPEAPKIIPVQLEAESPTQATELSGIAYVREIRSSKASVASSLYESIEENGRTYHKYKEGKYFLPNDELEQNRLDLQHHICKMSLHDRLFLAPLKASELKHALDFGTGTGIWAIEFADQFPNCQVIGSDLSMIQPEMIPRNLSFEIDDIEDTWVYPIKFNFIHGRLMAFAMESPASIFKNAFASLAPGGYFEMQDLHLPIRGLDDCLEGTTMARSSALLLDACTKVGMDPTTTDRYKSLMEAVGFVDIKEVVIEWPIGTWAKGEYHKRIGAWFRRDMEVGTEGILMGLFTRILGMSREEVLEMVAELKREMRDPKIHAFQPFHVVYGRKPY
ncbi:S-adenosyl-L-methionine-dependent methyltransferase [Amylocarpus encephaloides]|uniref:S-adenosyl-L-methionine-dependent methyltransferase n=1 Tax=Amylocarpus encephaloides TaxID=45428 RepID=A0A9P7Y8P4_9HELO|nr:S-adenosyl-L-methionine-dependent methyltransferase [Amylocarpus encephaloides]